MLILEHMWALLLFPLPWLVRQLAPAYGSERRSLRVPFFQALLKHQGQLLQTQTVQRRRKLQLFMLLMVWSLLVFAAAKPIWLGAAIEVREPARDLLVAVDLSGSMAEMDFAPQGQEALSRLGGAKKVLGQFAQARVGDRLGLMVYGDAPYLQLPFSEDKHLFVTLLEESRVRMAGPKTMLGDAIGFAYKHFQQDKLGTLAVQSSAGNSGLRNVSKKDSSQTERNKVLLLLSDGNDSGSRVPPQEAARLAASIGIKIYPVLLGKLDATAEQAVDEDQLKVLAEITGGRYFHAEDSRTLAEVGRILDQLEPSRYAVHYYRPSHNLFYWPVIIAVLMAYFVHFHLAFSAFRRPQNSIGEAGSCLDGQS